MAPLREKIGYGFGDMASSMFWKVFSYYLPFFYANVFGLSLIDTGVLLLVTRIWDAVSDPMMGAVADRTKTRWGKYRPYLLWVAAPFSICGILLFTTPDWGYAARLIWAYVTYILMMTVYTGINVPYGAMLGVMTDNSQEKTVFSSFRMFFAYGGSFIALFAWDPLCRMFQDGFGFSLQSSWQFAMIVIASCCFILFLLCFRLTREQLTTVSAASLGKDLKALVTNKPWWLLNGASLCFNLFNTVRGATVAFFFADIIGGEQHIVIFSVSMLFYSGLFLGVGEVANMVGVALAVAITKKLGKKPTFILVDALLIVFSIIFFTCSPESNAGLLVMLLLQVVISVLTGIMSPLVWSMYADVSDYSELKYRSASTGLIFSSASMAQKFGGAIGGAAVMWLLHGYGYVERPEGVQSVDIVQPDSAITCLWMLMTFIPAGVALLSLVIVWLYPLTTKRMDDIVAKLKQQRLNPVEEPGNSEVEPV
ncbi:MAG TPA: MFS transporter [Muribaculum sp.]|mgnify:FL=1|jgi:GPH family glycoside/pentoside/hexuronide:cation symporter|uniref:MFS transporter n=1 Tax=Heminiphilus faecis TaxID=2601703 RepID=UPI000EF56D37|nr:MFS transporter [Heminiphilus faecis]RLT75883.1 MFS transporter [bacterium J10(2018)]HRF69095.1 MFS transporter [Muribaculum sp.]